MPSAPVVLICLDSLPKPLILEGARDGRFPTFARLLAESRHWDTMNVRGFYSGSAWPSFMTGCFPAKHGIYSWMQLIPGTYDEERYLTGERLKHDPFWLDLSRAGKTVAVLDVPATKALPLNGGIQLAEWGCHEDHFGVHSTPEELAAEAVRLFGDHPIKKPRHVARDTEGMADYKRRLLAGVEAKSRLTRHYLEQKPWDFFLQVFTEPHDAGHMCWHIHDPSHPWHRPEEAAIVGDPVLETAVATDRALGEVLDAIPSNATTLVLMSHGMGPYYGARHLLDDILIGLGHSVPVPPPPQRPPTLGERLDGAATWTWQKMPGFVRRALEPLKRRLRGAIDGPRASKPPPVVRAESNCFTVVNPSTSAIRVNLKGREPEGKVAPEDYDAYCEQVCRDLLELRNGENGEPVVEMVVRVAEAFSGPHRDDLPDIMIEWNRSGPVSVVESDKLTAVAGEYDFVRSGDHQPEGMLFAAGPGVEPGHVEEVADIVDIAPTVAALLGVELRDVDGRVIPGVAG